MFDPSARPAGSSLSSSRGTLGLSGYQWLVLLAAWLGWGFDAFDAMLFNNVAPLCVPGLLHLAAGDPRVPGAVSQWTGLLTSLLLVGWALGGVLFGRITDRVGRTQALFLTMATYAVGTAACALAPNLGALAACRFIAALGIGGEWAAGAALVAETVPEEKRVLAGALLYTSTPLGVALATAMADLFMRRIPAFSANPDLAWRATFLTGLLPVVFAVLIRLWIREPQGFRRGQRPQVRELFGPALRRRTASGLAMALTALIAWWTCNAFLAPMARFLALREAPHAVGQTFDALRAQVSSAVNQAFNLGGLAGNLLLIWLAARLSRRHLFLGYFSVGAVAIWVCFAFALPLPQRLFALGLVGASIFGILAAFPIYLPELFPMRLRGTGAGFCYNVGRVVTAVGPTLVGHLSRKGGDPGLYIRWVALVPACAVLLLLFGGIVETRGAALEA